MHVICCVGTRPEAIKMAPVIRTLRQIPGLSVKVVSTGQHRELLTDTLKEFGIESDIDLRLMSENQSLSDLTGRLFPALAKTFEQQKPTMVLAEGDTTTVFVASVVAFYLNIPFGHVEAGLRTGDLRHPFPEEFNRVVAARTAALHFAPTSTAKSNLLREGIAESTVYVTGNTVIDALLSVAEHIPDEVRNGRRRRILVTAHRRENFGRPLREVFEALRNLVGLRPDLEIVYPVHPNPNVSGLAHELLRSTKQVRISPPLNYRQFVAAMKWCDLVLTDSGGLQEEAPALGKPVLILRESTERPEAVAAGVAKTVGTSRSRIVSEVMTLLEDDAAYAAMAVGSSPYGDGRAAERIAAVVGKYLSPKVERRVKFSRAVVSSPAVSVHPAQHLNNDALGKSPESARQS